jgi:hypothetical protein
LSCDIEIPPTRAHVTGLHLQVHMRLHLHLKHVARHECPPWPDRGIARGISLPER